jgi:uncharacterized damage-inducible protein DinB
METSELLADAFERVRETAAAALDGLSDDQLTFRPSGDANSIAWLIWHLVRVQDDHVAEVAGTEQIWTAAGWHERLGFPFEADATGYGHSPDEVAAVQGCSARDLVGYLDAVHEQTVSFVRGLGPEDLDRVVDRRWDPPVTLGVRLVSVISDDLQHAGQAAYVRGLLSD